MSTPTFGEPELITVEQLRVGDFLLGWPAQGGIASAVVDSAVRELREDWDTWSMSYGARRRRTPVRSRVIAVLAPDQPERNLPVECTVRVRRPQ